MNNNEINFIKILSNICHPKANIELIQPVESKEIAKIAARHNILPIVCDEAEHIPSFTSVSSMQKIKYANLQLVVEQTKRTAEFLRLYREFTENGIYPIVIKGIICRQLYGKRANLRISADEDILIKASDFADTHKILERNGFECERKIISDKQLNEVQEITFSSKNSTLRIEVHLNLFGTSDKKSILLNSFFENSFENYDTVELISPDRSVTSVRTLTPANHVLFMMLHAYKHFTGTGIGLRQFMDIMLFQEKYKDKIDTEQLKKMLQKASIYKFYTDILHIGNEYLGFTFDIPEKPICPHELLQDLINSGIFGNDTQEKRTAVNAIRAAQEGSKYLFFMRIILPSRKKMVMNFPVLVDHPYLLPYCWLVRIGHFIKHSHDAKGNLAVDSIKISQKRLKLINHYK